MQDSIPHARQKEREELISDLRHWPEATPNTIHKMKPLTILAAFLYAVQHFAIQFNFMSYWHIDGSFDTYVNMHREYGIVLCAWNRYFIFTILLQKPEYSGDALAPYVVRS